MEIFEVKLDEEFLMSSLYTEGEIALARLGLAGLGDGPLVTTARSRLLDSGVRRKRRLLRVVTRRLMDGRDEAQSGHRLLTLGRCFRAPSHEPAYRR